MGIKIEFNPDLALRAHGAPGRAEEECLPKQIKKEGIHQFLKEGQRNYWLEGELPLVETKGEGRLSRPVASITILEVAHFKKGGKVYTKGRYKVNEVFDIDDSKVHFEGMSKIK